ncbi:MAG: hypothetical protein D6826_10965 [Alphaproteobacteria bacterium]|nr:MAG: hypothetical protein D6826_10965 [Alphaproteobacteria bacterium]
MALLVRGKNISEKTFLATDYLNHFNEVVMLLELVPDMPDCLADAKEWKPKSYVEHFRDSTFSDKDLAIFAYENAPPRYREPFDHTVAAMDRLIGEGIARIEAAIAADDPARLAAHVNEITTTLRRYIDIASAIIHGDDDTLDQARIDAIMGG